jgi:dCMP deaminase
MKTAHTFAELSHARRLKVGAIVVKDDRIISIGYNGMPSGWDNNCEYEELGFSDAVFGEPQTLISKGLKTRPEVLHAEMNALFKLARSNESGLGAIIFITHSPCIECAKGIYQAGIQTVYYSQDYRDQKGIDFLKQCNINVWKLTVDITPFNNG